MARVVLNIVIGGDEMESDGFGQSPTSSQSQLQLHNQSVERRDQISRARRTPERTTEHAQ